MGVTKPHCAVVGLGQGSDTDPLVAPLFCGPRRVRRVPVGAPVRDRSPGRSYGTPARRRTSGLRFRRMPFLHRDGIVAAVLGLVVAGRAAAGDLRSLPGAAGAGATRSPCSPPHRRAAGPHAAGCPPSCGRASCGARREQDAEEPRGGCEPDDRRAGPRQCELPDLAHRSRPASALGCRGRSFSCGSVAARRGLHLRRR